MISLSENYLAEHNLTPARMSPPKKTRSLKHEAVDQAGRSLSDVHPLSTIFNNGNLDRPLTGEDHATAAELSTTESIVPPAEQGGSGIPLPQDIGTSATNSATKPSRGPSQEQIRRLDKYAQCPHCSLVNAVAGNLKTHWVVQKAHADEQYDVGDVWIFEREGGSQGPHTRRRNGDKLKSKPHHNNVSSANRAILGSRKTRDSGQVKIESPYFAEADPNDDAESDDGSAVRDKRQTRQGPRYSMENGDLNFMQEESQSEGGRNWELSQTTRRGNGLPIPAMRQPESRNPGQHMGYEPEREDDPADDEIGMASLQSRHLSRGGMQMYAPISQSSSTQYLQRYEPPPNNPYNLTGNQIIPNLASQIPMYAPNLSTVFGKKQTLQTPTQRQASQGIHRPAFAADQPLTSLRNQGWQSIPPAVNSSEDEPQMLPPNPSRSSAAHNPRFSSSASSLHSKKRRGSQRTVSPTERDLGWRAGFDVGFNAAWYKAQEQVQSRERAKEETLARLGLARRD